MKVYIKFKYNLGILIVLFLILLVFSNSNMTAQINRPFSFCYQQYFTGCSNCSNETLGYKTLTYLGCDITVTYKIKTCDCPQPTTFVDVEYLRINPNNPLCNILMVQLYPPSGIYNPSNLNLQAYKTLSRNIYDQLVFDLFKEVQDNFNYPNELTFKVFWPASCDAVCQITLVENDSTVILQTKPCNIDICCGLEYKYSYLGNNQYQSIITQITGEVTCYAPFGINCDYSEGDEIILPDGNYHVLNAEISECTTFCDNP